MKILADNNDYIISLTIALGKLGHQVATVNTDNVYNLVRSDKPDLVFVGNSRCKLLKCCIDEKMPVLLYGDGPYNELDNCVGICSNNYVNEKSIVIDNFGDKNLYGGYAQYKLESDILFSTNYNLNFLPRLQFIQDHNLKIKIAGRNHVKLPYFVGFTDKDSFGSLAKSAKIVVSSNYFEYLSLIHQDILCVYHDFEDDLDSLIKDEGYRRKLVKEYKAMFAKNTSDNQALKINDRIMEWKN